MPSAARTPPSPGARRLPAPRRGRRAALGIGRGLWLALASAGLALAAPQGGSFDSAPFSTGPIWSLAASPGAPWIARSLAFDPRGQSFLAGASVANPAALLLGAQWEQSPGGGVAPLLASRPLVAAATHAVRVAFAGANRWALYAEPAQSGQTRLWLERLELPLDGQILLPSAAFDLGAAAVGPFQLAGGETGLWCARLDPQAGTLSVERRAPHTGLLEAQVQRSAAALRALSVSADGQRALVASSSEVLLIGAQGQLLGLWPATQAPSAIALSGDGRRLAIGDGSGVRIYGEDPSGAFVGLVTIPLASAELPTALGFDPQGGELAIGLWNSVNGTAVRLLQARFSSAGVLLLLRELYASNPPGPGLQNYVSQAQVSAEGARLVFGLWGQGGPEPECLAFAADSGALVLSLDLPGSVEALALSPEGTRLALAHKATHSNQFSSQGSLRLVSLAPEELSLARSLRPTSPVDLVVRGDGALAAWLLIGLPAPALALPFGLLQLEPSSVAPPVGLLPRSSGDFELGLTLGAGSAAAGLPIAAQVLRWFGRGNWSLGESRRELAVY